MYLNQQAPHLNAKSIIRNLKVKSVECNLTLPTIGVARPSDVIHLLDMSFDKTVMYRRKNVDIRCAKSNTCCLFSKPKAYCLKAYDKHHIQCSYSTISTDRYFVTGSAGSGKTGSSHNGAPIEELAAALKSRLTSD